MVQSHLSEVEEMINSSYHGLNDVGFSGKEEKEAVKVFKQKLDTIQNLHRKAQGLFDLFNSGLLNNILNLKTKKITKKKPLWPEIAGETP